MQDLGSITRLGRSPLRRERLTTLVFWPGEFHGLYSPWGHKESNTTERLSLHTSLPSFPLFHRGEVRDYIPNSCPLTFLDYSWPSRRTNIRSERWKRIRNLYFLRAVVIRHSGWDISQQLPNELMKNYALWLCSGSWWEFPGDSRTTAGSEWALQATCFKAFGWDLCTIPNLYFPSTSNISPWFLSIGLAKMFSGFPMSWKNPNKIFG